MFQFKTGDQQSNISCPDTKFHDTVLEGQNSVLASCGPKKDTFTVKDKEGYDLAKGVRSLQFGCGRESIDSLMIIINTLFFHTPALWVHNTSLDTCQRLS